MTRLLKKQLKLLLTKHSPNGEPNVFIHSLPRSGSTWLMELVLTQPGFMKCNEPLNLDRPEVRDHLGTSDWPSLHTIEMKDRLFEYIDSICSGRLRDARFNRPGPFSGFYRPITRRVVLKIISAGQEYINCLSEKFNGRTVFLIRHPIPVALSRKKFPMLNGIMETEFRRFFTEKQIRLGTRLLNSESKFGRAILDWCMQNSVALRSRTDEWVMVTYEQLVVDPLPLVRQMVERLELPRPNRIVSRLKVPSQSTVSSDKDTQQVLGTSRNHSQQQWLVEKWREGITNHDLMLAAEILETFGLDRIYSVSDSRPNAAYWVS